MRGRRRRRGCEGGKELRTVLRTRSEHGVADRWADLWMARAAGGLFIPWAMVQGPWPQHDALRRSWTWAAGRPCSETASRGEVQHRSSPLLPCLHPCWCWCCRCLALAAAAPRQHGRARKATVGGDVVEAGATSAPKHNTGPQRWAVQEGEESAVQQERREAANGVPQAGWIGAG